MARIAQIIPYFGKWPEWMELYLYSCSRNPMVDFIFYTDCTVDSLPVYPNVRFIKTTISEYANLVSERLGIDYRLESPYKLTDLKPFLGAIHAKELEGYEFWSFGDIDLCYGDLSKLLNNRILGKYDLITTHCYHIAGHLTVMKNNEYYRTLCFKIKDWQSKISDKKHYGLDEGEWSELVYPGIYYPRLLWRHMVRRLKICSFFSFMNFANSLLNRKQLFHEFYTSPVPVEGQEWVYDLGSGKVTNPEGMELPYIHFLFFKKTQWHDSETYWREDYYKLKSDFSDSKEVVVSLNGIISR